MAATKRTQNKCKKCGYTWYPRGRNISLKCPSCGSNEVGYAGGGVALVGLLIVGVMIFGGDKKSNAVAPAESNNVAAAVDRTERPTATGGELFSQSSKSSRSEATDAGSDESPMHTLDSARPSGTDAETTDPVRNTPSSSESKRQAECEGNNAHPQSVDLDKCGSKGTVSNDLY